MGSSPGPPAATAHRLALRAQRLPDRGVKAASVTPTSHRTSDRSRPGALDLYERRWDGELLHPGDLVISADEKTQIQARRRTYPTPAPASRRAQRVEHDYDRGGALCLPGRLGRAPRPADGRCEPQTGIAPFGAPGRAGHDCRALRARPTRVLDRRQRLLTPRPSRRRAHPGRVAEPRARAPALSTPPGSTRSRSSSRSSSARS